MGVLRICKYCGAEFEGGPQSKVCPACISIQRAKGGRASWSKMTEEDRNKRSKKARATLNNTRKINGKTFEEKRMASWHKWYDGLSNESKEEIIQKQLHTKAKKYKESGKIKYTIPGKWYTKNGKMQIVGLNNYRVEIYNLFKGNICKYCGEGYYGRGMGKNFCSKECYEKFRVEIGKIGIHLCKTCGKEFKPKRAKNSTYCSVQCANRDREVNHKTISDINLKRGEWLKSIGYTPFYEYPLGKFSYDIQIDNNILIEINPSAFHSSTYSPYGKEYIKDKEYHYNKTHYAIDNGYKCINIRDWTTADEVLQMIKKDFVYNGKPSLHRCNRKTGERYDNNPGDKYIVGVYDSGKLEFI